MRRRWLSLLTAVVLIGLIAAPVSAAKGGRHPVGDQINLISATPSEFDSATSFHVIHGFGLEPGVHHPVGKWSFSLEVDGVDQGKGQLVNESFGDDGVARRFLFNFEDGLGDGDHEFVGHWYAPCAAAVDAEFYAGPCAKANEVVEVLTVSHTVNFTP